MNRSSIGFDGFQWVFSRDLMGFKVILLGSNVIGIQWDFNKGYLDFNGTY